MDIITICDQNWISNHLTRFIKLGQRAMPDAKFHALIVSNDRIKHPTLDLFDSVRFCKEKEQTGYLYWNELRYSLLKRFKLSECLYVDPDVDIFADISDIAEMHPKAELMAVRSPVTPAGFDELFALLGISPATPSDPVINSGMMYLRRDLLKEYKAASKRAMDAGFNPRMIGNVSFSIMQRTLPPGSFGEIPYHYGLIWWDEQTSMLQENGMTASAWMLAKTVHYCNDQGKEYRAWKDGTWLYLNKQGA